MWGPWRQAEAQEVHDDVASWLRDGDMLLARDG